MDDDRLRRVAKPIPHAACSGTPVAVLRHAVLKSTNRIEHRAPDEHRGRDSEAEFFDVPLVVKGEDALKGFRGGHALWISDEDVDPTANEISVPEFG